MSTAPVVAIDLGGTKIRAAVVAATGQIVAEDRRPTRADQGRDAVLEQMTESAQRAIALSGLPVDDFAAVGVSAPGPCDFDRGILLQPPNLPGWEAVPLAELVEQRLGLPAILENDANAAALGELRHGAGWGARHLIYLTVSTGIGGGLILDGRIYRGADGTAGELGHVTVDEQGPLHTCGMRGCLEVMASGTAIGQMGQQAAVAGRSERLTRAAERGEVTAADVHDAADAGDAAAIEIVGTASHYLGVGLASFLNIFNPDAIVLGGGVAMAMGAQLLRPAFELARSRAFELPARTVRFQMAALEGRAEAVGVAILARESLGQDQA